MQTPHAGSYLQSRDQGESQGGRNYFWSKNFYVCASTQAKTDTLWMLVRFKFLGPIFHQKFLYDLLQVFSEELDQKNLHMTSMGAFVHHYGYGPFIIKILSLHNLLCLLLLIE